MDTRIVSHGKLGEQDYSILRSMLNKRIMSLEIEKGGLHFRPELHIVCNGLCRFNIPKISATDRFLLDIKSKMLTDNGLDELASFNLGLQHFKEKPLAVTRMDKAARYQGIGSFSVSYPTNSPVKTITIFGTEQIGQVLSLYPDNDIDYLISNGMDNNTICELSSTDFIVIQHINETILILANYGFATQIFFNYQHPLDYFIKDRSFGLEGRTVLIQKKLD